MNMNIFKENLIIPNFDEFNNFNSDEIFLSESAFSPGPYNPNNQNDCNFLINQGNLIFKMINNLKIPIL